MPGADLTCYDKQMCGCWKDPAKNSFSTVQQLSSSPQEICSSCVPPLSVPRHGPPSQGHSRPLAASFSLLSLCPGLSLQDLCMLVLVPPVVLRGDNLATPQKPSLSCHLQSLSSKEDRSGRTCQVLPGPHPHLNLMVLAQAGARRTAWLGHATRRETFVLCSLRTS
jgi:hypothetical protein